MKVFISWSGERSQTAALKIKEFLDSVFGDKVNLFVSSEDLVKGSPWFSDIADELNESTFGIVCLTPENLKAPWIHFEAGAVFKASGNQKSWVCPLLFDLKKSEVKKPLSELQVTEFEEKDFYKLVKDLNEAIDASIEPHRLDQLFEAFWSSIETLPGDIGDRPKGAENPTREPGDLLEEVLSIVRDLRRSGRLSSPWRPNLRAGSIIQTASDRAESTPFRISTSDFEADIYECSIRLEDLERIARKKPAPFRKNLLPEIKELETYIENSQKVVHDQSGPQAFGYLQLLRRIGSLRNLISEESMEGEKKDPPSEQ